MAGEVVGSVSERSLLDALYAGKASLTDSVGSHMDERLPLIGSGEPVSEVRAALSGTDAVMIVRNGKPTGVLTRADLLGEFAE